MSEIEASTRDEWLTVSQVAAALEISERTVRRRCENGKLAARLITADSGPVWQIEAAAVIAADAAATLLQAADGLRTGDKSEGDEAADTAAKVEKAADTPADTLPESLRTPAVIAADSDTRVLALENEMLREALQREKEAVERERENADQWRAQVEAANRQAAEATASVRELTRALNTFRALPGSEYLQEERGVQEADPNIENDAVNKKAAVPKSAEQGATRREPRPLWKLLLGLR